MDVVFSFFSFIIGAITSFFIDILATAMYPTVYLRYKMWILKRLARNRTRHTEVDPEHMVIAGLPVDWIVLERANYTPDRINSFYDNTTFVLEPEFQTMLQDFIQEIEERRAEGNTKTPYDSYMYKLKECQLGYREIINGEEVPILRLKFGPTSYYEQAVTDLNTNNPIRNKYARNPRFPEEPIPEFSSILGVNLGLVTNDGNIIISERSKHAYTAGDSFHTSVAENLLRPTDTHPDGSPDPFRCAIRGAQEELGIEIDYKDVRIIAFGAHPTTCQYSLLGWQQIPYSKKEVIDRRRRGVPKDKWENRKLHFIPFNPEDVAVFIFNNWNRWHSIGLATIVLTLYQVYPENEVNNIFLQVRTRLSI